MAANVPIRTIHVAPIKPSIKGEIEKYFGQFGKVEKARFVTSKTTKNFEYCLVQFETVEGAKAALKNEKHRILNANVKVKAAHDRIQPDSKEYYEQADEDFIWELCHGNDSDVDQEVEDLCDFFHQEELGHERDYDDFDYDPYEGINFAQANYDSDQDESS